MSRMIRENNLTIWIGWDNFSKKFWIYVIDDGDAVILDLGLTKHDVSHLKTPENVEKEILERLGIQLSAECLVNLNDDMNVIDVDNHSKSVQLFGFWD